MFLLFLTTEHVNEAKITILWHHSCSDRVYKKRYVNGSCLGLRNNNSLSVSFAYFSFVYFLQMSCFGRISGILLTQSLEGGHPNASILNLVPTQITLTSNTSNHSEAN